MADARGLGPRGETLGGSNPSVRMMSKAKLLKCGGGLVFCVLTFCAEGNFVDAKTDRNNEPRAPTKGAR
jgi:hypothetical protein